MTATQLAATELVDGIPARRLLEALGRAHRWVLVTDSHQNVLWMSEGVSSLFGIEDLGPGVDARSFVPKLPHPEQVFSLRTQLRNRSHVNGAPLEVRLRDGRVVPVDVSVLRVETSGSAGPLLVAIAHPLDEDAEAPGAPSADSVEAEILEAAPQALLAVDGNGIVDRANRAAERLLGRSRSQLEGRPVTLLLSDSASEIERIAGALIAEGETREIELSLALESGAERAVTVSVGRRPGKAGGCVLVLRDVTERSLANAELRRANGELEHCVNSLAHDLRSPLVALLGFSRLLRQDYGRLLDETGAHFLDRIEQAGRTMEGLIHDLLELSRIGQPGERPSLVDPRAVLYQLKAELKPRLDAGGIRLSLPETPPPLVYCDRTRLYQVFSNLIGNAIEHMGEVEDPHIEVTVEESESSHTLCVADNGCGVPEEHHQRIFEVFQSLAPRSDGRRGTGIGLAIVKKIAEKHGGEVWLESRPGNGSRFHLRLPRP